MDRGQNRHCDAQCALHSQYELLKMIISVCYSSSSLGSDQIYRSGRHQPLYTGKALTQSPQFDRQSEHSPFFPIPKPSSRAAWYTPYTRTFYRIFFIHHHAVGVKQNYDAWSQTVYSIVFINIITNATDRRHTSEFQSTRLYMRCLCFFFLRSMRYKREKQENGFW